MTQVAGGLRLHQRSDVLEALRALAPSDWPEAQPYKLRKARESALVRHARLPAAARQIADRLDGDEGKRVLELRAGVCALSLELAARGHTVTAIEPIGENVIVGELAARAAGLDTRITVVRRALTRLDQIDGPFDAVVSNRGLLAVDLAGAAAEMRSALVTGGQTVLALHGPGAFLEHALIATERGDLDNAARRLAVALSAHILRASGLAPLEGRQRTLEPTAVKAILGAAGFRATVEPSYGRLGATAYMTVEAVAAAGTQNVGTITHDVSPAGLEALLRGDFARALTEFNDDAEQSGSSALLAGYCFLELDQIEPALGSLEAAVRRFDDSQPLRIAQLLALARAGDLNASRAAWVDLLRLLRLGATADVDYCAEAITRLNGARSRASGAAGEASPAVTVSLRRFPYPYRAMLALSNDIDLMSLLRFRTVHRFLNTLEDTEMGPGIGLDVADSMWFYHQPELGTEPDSNVVAYFSSRDWGQPSDVSEEVLHYVRHGWIDTLHAYGNWSQVTAREDQFTRRHAEEALAVLARSDLKLRVWVNHGDRCNIQNVGRHPFMEGDHEDSQAYHWDLTRAAGVEFTWTPVDSFNFSEASALSAMSCQDGRKVWQFSRFHNASYEQAISDGLLPSVARQHRRRRNYANLWHAPHLHLELTGARLQTLIENQEFAIVAQHLGAAWPMGALGGPAIAALRRLRAFQDAGQILVARTERLLQYNLVREYVRYTTEWVDDRMVIDVTDIDDPVRGHTAPELERLRGLTFHVPRRVRVELRIAGVPVPSDDVSYNPSDGSGASIGVAWFQPDVTDYTREFASRPGGVAIPQHAGETDLVAFLAGLKGAADRETDRKRSYAIQYAINRLGGGLRGYRRRLDALGFTGFANGIDIGCGAGQWSLAFAQQNESVLGIDSGPEFVAVASKLAAKLGLQKRAQFQTGRAEQLPVEDASFDVALAHSVLMYTDAELAIAEVGRVLKPGGAFYCAYSSFGFRLESLRAAIASGDFASIKSRIALLVSDRLYRIGLFRTGYSRVRALTLDELIGIADLHGLGFVDEPGVQDGTRFFLGHRGTVDFAARKPRGGTGRRDALLAMGAGEAILEELDLLLDQACPNGAASVIEHVYGDPLMAAPEVRRRYLHALIKAGREHEPIARQLVKREKDPLVRGLFCHQRAKHDEALKFYELLDPGQPMSSFLTGAALVALGRIDEAERAFARGADAGDDISCRLGLLDVLVRRRDGLGVVSAFAGLLRELSAATGALTEAETMIAGLPSRWEPDANDRFQ